MDESEKNFKKIDFKRNYELSMTEFYKELSEAISTNNIQSIYGLSKILTRYIVKKLDT